MMFEITAAAMSSLADLLPDSAEITLLDLKPPLDAPYSGERPFVQISSDEIDGQRVDELLGYADIPHVGAPIGVDGLREPRRLQGDVLLFPLDGLERHLESVAPTVVAQWRLAGSMDAFAKMRGDAMTAEEYLVGGVLECLRHCRERGELLTIHW